MAGVSQPPTTTAAVAHSVSAPQLTSKLLHSPKLLTASNPRSNSTARSGLKPLTPPLAKRLLAPQLELTGAAAAADSARYSSKDLMVKQSMANTSPNPARTPLLAAAAAVAATSQQPMSRPSDAPQTHSSPAPQIFKSSLGPPTSSSGNAVEQNSHASATRNGVQSSGPPSPKPGYEPVLNPPMRPPSNQNLHPNIFASPRQSSPEAMPVGKSSSDRSRKRLHSPPSLREPSPTYSSYPPLTPASELSQVANRNASLPNSSSRSGGRSPAAKKHRCPHCATEFTRHHNLKSHLLTHSQEKPYGCETCTARFRRLHDLKRHLKLHTGERPHVCEICGRAFARGDALARHNKGPGRCAGRRESGVDEDDLDIDEDEDEADMAGDGGGEGGGGGAEHMQRRKSEPNKRRRRSSNHAPALSAQQSHGSTYPPVAPMGSAPQAYYQPQQNSSWTPAGRSRGMSPPRHRAPSLSVPGFQTVHYNHQPPGMYAQGSVTESPKPLSPGQPPDPHPSHRGADASMHGRSPSISTRMQQQNLLRSNTGSGTSPHALPPSHQHLPSMQTSDHRFPPGGSRLPPPSISTQAPSSGGQSRPPSAGPASASSHPHSSGGSIRELYGPPPSGPHSSHDAGAPQQEDLVGYIRQLQEQHQQERLERAREREEHAKLRDELLLLKAEMAAKGHGGRR